MSYYNEEQLARMDEARAIAARFRAGDIPPFDELMDQIAKWRKPEDLAREICFDILDGWMRDYYGEYWHDKRTPWIPI